jgi:hypothetical protein
MEDMEDIKLAKLTQWPCHLHEKVSYSKRRIMEIQNFHRAKI